MARPKKDAADVAETSADVITLADEPQIDAPVVAVPLTAFGEQLAAVLGAQVVVGSPLTLRKGKLELAVHVDDDYAGALGKFQAYGF